MSEVVDSNSSPRDNTAVLLTIYQDSSSEMTRFRDLEWKLSGVSIVLLSSLAPVLAQSSVQVALASWILLRVLMASVIAILPIALILFYCHSQKSLKFHRGIRNRIESTLGLYRRNEYGTPLPIIPPHQKKRKVSIAG